MNHYIVYAFNSVMSPSLSKREVEAYDIIAAAQQSGFTPQEIIAVKLRAPIDLGDD